MDKSTASDLSRVYEITLHLDTEIGTIQRSNGYIILNAYEYLCKKQVLPFWEFVLSMQIDLMRLIEWPNANINWQTDQINNPWQNSVPQISSQSCMDNVYMV